MYYYTKRGNRMASDCTVAIDNGYINLRVGAIIQKNGKFLMVGNQKMIICIQWVEGLNLEKVPKKLS